MKKLLLFLGFIVIGSSLAVAQEQKDPKQARADWEKKIKDELKLDNDQVLKFDALNKEYNEKMDALTSDASLTKEAQKEKKMALKKEKDAKLMEFLTPEQQTKYKELLEKKKKEMAEKATS